MTSNNKRTIPERIMTDSILTIVTCRFYRSDKSATLLPMDIITINRKKHPAAAVANQHSDLLS
ncbi:hypothetical protein [Methylohalomonas lacus]|nr:hypothetical protein [Methylohalomonas lacus]